MERKEIESEQKTATLESEVKKFANQLPYWAKYLADKILKGIDLNDEDFLQSYNFLLEDLNHKYLIERPDIIISYSSYQTANYKKDLILNKLEDVEGVNALKENQLIEFSPNLTIIYGANGSGKSGYVRLFKKAFYSKVPEEILPNIHGEANQKAVNAKFTFASNNNISRLNYPINDLNTEFEQFSVFDGKGLFKQLVEKNEFEFRPAGLNFFSKYTEAIKIIEKKLFQDIQIKTSVNNFNIWFDGESSIKEIVINLNSKTKIEDLKSLTPFSEEDKKQKNNYQKLYDELLISSNGKDVEIKKLREIKRLLNESKAKIENQNLFFTNKYLIEIKEAISSLNEKEKIAKTEGTEKFSTDKITGIGTLEWKHFIESADKFAEKQNELPDKYPTSEDNCLFCHQELSAEAQNLIRNYRNFIKSTSEENALKAKNQLNLVKEGFEKLDFNLFPENNILTIWLKDKYHQQLITLNQKLLFQEKLAELVISDITEKNSIQRDEIFIDTTAHQLINDAIDNSIKLLTEDEASKELKKLQDLKRYFDHKEKFNIHYSKFIEYIENKILIENLQKANFNKRNVTDTEKLLANKYFNQQYIDAFNEECQRLNGKFDIKVNHTGSEGKSYRQLKLKGNNPSAILSEGEQKVIAIADFIAEMKLSQINRGIILDDPVTSLDEKRKSEIAHRLAEESKIKQVVIFTHDLVFVSSLIGHCQDLGVNNECHWIENIEGIQPGVVWLRNTPSFEKDYKTSGKAQAHYENAKKSAPELRENKIKNGFAALRTSYETQVVFGLFKGVVQRFEERVSVDSLKNVNFTVEIRDEILESFYQCCRFMEGHSHSDKYAYKKPTLEDLDKEIQRFNSIKRNISDLGKV